MSDRVYTLNRSSDEKLKSIHQAIADILPLSLAVVPWGILCGSLALQVGLTPMQAQLMSLLVFAGAAQLASLTIIGGVGYLSSIFSSTVVISSRHLLYSAVFREHVKKIPTLQRCCIAFLLTDEMFAVTCAYLEKYEIFNPLYTISSGMVFYIIWNISTFAGIVAGGYIPNIEAWGLEFAIAATFIAIVIPSIKNISTLIAVLVSGLSILILSFQKNENALIIATVIGMAAGFFSHNEDKDNG